MFFQSLFLLSLHTCTCTFSFQRVLRVIITSSFYFVIVICLFCTGRPADVYLFMWIFLKLSVILLTLVLVFVTRVLALCRNGWKQMSNLPFLFLLKNKLWHTELMTQNSISNARVICRGWTVELIFSGKAQLPSKDCFWWSLQQPSMSPYLQWWKLSEWDCWPDEWMLWR